MIRLLLVLLLLSGPAAAQVPRAAEQYRLAVIASAATAETTGARSRIVRCPSV